MTLKLPPFPSNDLHAWARMITEYLIESISSENVLTDPTPVQLQHKISDREKAIVDGVLMFDPVNQAPVFSHDGLWRTFDAIGSLSYNATDDAGNGTVADDINNSSFAGQAGAVGSCAQCTPGADVSFYHKGRVYVYTGPRPASYGAACSDTMQSNYLAPLDGGEFIKLSDTPSTYTGNALTMPRVDVNSSAIEFSRVFFIKDMVTLRDSNLDYSIFQIGDLIRSEREGFGWVVVSDATGDARTHLQTAGGLRLQALPMEGDKGVVCPEQFGCFTSTSVSCLDRLQIFVNEVIRLGYFGRGRGLYSIDDTLLFNNAFIDGVNDDEGTLTTFSFSFGDHPSDFRGIHYIGSPGTGPEPENCKPAISLHNVNRFNFEKLYIINNRNNEERYSCAFRWTGSGNNQRGNCKFDDIQIVGFERGLVWGLYEAFGQSGVTTFDIIEKAQISRCQILQTRHPVYISCNTGDAWHFTYLRAGPYNVTGGPKFRKDDPTDATATEKIVEITGTGTGCIVDSEMAQHDMISDGSGVVWSTSASTQIMRCSIEIFNALRYKHNNANASRNSTTIENFRSQPDGFGENGWSYWFWGPARMVDCGISGKVRALRGVDLINCQFIHTESIANYTIDDIIAAFFSLYGGNVKENLNIVNLRVVDANGDTFDNASFTWFGNNPHTHDDLETRITDLEAAVAALQA